MDDPFRIDPDRLADEWIRQPGMTREAGTAEADARHAHAQAKARLGVVEARLRLAVRRRPDAYGLPERPTVDAVADTVTLQPEYQEALRQVDEAKHVLDVLSTNTTALVDRRKALERLVELTSLDYYAEKEPRAHSPAAREQIGRRVATRDRERGIDQID